MWLSGRTATGDQPIPSTSATPTFWVGLDVHKDSVTAAVFRNRDAELMRVDRLPSEMHGVGAARLLYAGPHGGRVTQTTVDSWVLGGAPVPLEWR